MVYLSLSQLSQTVTTLRVAVVASVPLLISGTCDSHMRHTPIG
jgi:hypothetical protein